MSGASHWLTPLMPGIPGLTVLDARRMNSFERTLGDLLSAYPIGPSVEPELRSQRLARIRRELAPGGHLGLAVPARDGGCGRPAVTQALMQFICGYHDADLRDATGLGHGRLIALHGTAPAREQWLPRLIAGDVPGIAITEPIGGSQVHAITTVATTHHDGTWTLNGTKTWISRLNEAAVFIVFFKDPSGRLTAGIWRKPGATSGRCFMRMASMTASAEPLAAPCSHAVAASGRRNQLARVPPSSDATVPAAKASRHAATRRATSGVTLLGTWSGGTKA